MRALWFLALAAALHAQGRPNILWISSEDNGPDLGCYGSAAADTPNLDRLAADGIVYTRAWSNAPVCSTARTTIITGCYPFALGAEHHRSRVRLPAHVRPFPLLLRQAGYRCTNNSKTDYNLTDTGRIWDASSTRAHWRDRATGQPFFAVFNLTVSHESKIRERPHAFVHDPATVPIPPQHPDTPEVREGWAQYHDQLTAMDAQAGRILDQLAADGLADDTIVFYWGDHGAGMPGFKRNPKDQGMHVPLIVRVPERWRAHAADLVPGSRTDRLVAFVDLAPTVLSLAGVAPPTWMHGRAFLGPHAGAPKDTLLGYRGRMDERDDLVRTLTDGRYVYVRNFLPWLPLGQHVAYMFETPTTRVWKRLFDEGSLDDVRAAFWRPRPPEELYDLAADPAETTNLATSPGHRPTLERLRATLRARLVELGDVSLVPEAEMNARAGDGAPWALVHGDDAPVDFPHLLDVAWRASSGDPADEPALARAAADPEPAVRTWALRGLAARAAVDRHRDAFARAVGDPSPDVRITAAEALVRARDDAAARDALVALADRRTAGFFAAVAAWNAVDRLDLHMAPARGALAAIPADVADVPAHARSYLPRLREVALAGLAPPPRSVVLILADDLGAECLGCYGGTSYATPELDRLAARGVRFTEAHTQTLCTPTRLELLTGLSNARNYVEFSVLPKSATTVAELLHDAGYATGAFGKWQLYGNDGYPVGVRGTGTLPEDAGFDTHCLWQVEGLGSSYWGPTVRIEGATRTFGDDVYGPDVFADHLLRFVEANRDRPFLAFWPMALTHAPFTPPPPKPDDVTPGPRHFGAMVAYMDQLVGRVARRVEELGLADRTLILFIGDNGTGRAIRSRVGDRVVRGGKGTTTATGTHVPMIAWGPGLVQEGAVVDDLVSTRDVLPTLVELAGATRPDVLDGRSLLPHLRGEAIEPRDALAFWYWPRPTTRPRSQPVRFALDRRYVMDDAGRVFDRDADPEETRSPVEVDPDVRARLRRALDALPPRKN